MTTPETKPESARHTPPPWATDGRMIVQEVGGSRANAHFIVKTVNCHAELLEACKVVQHMFNESMFVWGVDDQKLVSSMLHSLQAAITKAE